MCLTREACHFLSESSVSAEQLTQQLALLTDTLALHGDPPLVWFSPERVAGPRLAESLRFGMLELKEHLDTFLDRKDHAAEVCVLFLSFITGSSRKFVKLKNHISKHNLYKVII